MTTNLLKPGFNPNNGGGGGTAEWGDITGTLSNQTDLQMALNAKVNTALIGQPNGVAPTDANNKVPLTFIPDGLVSVIESAQLYTVNAVVGNEYQITVASGTNPTAYFNGLTVKFINTVQVNSGAATVNINGIGPIAIADSTDRPMNEGDIGLNDLIVLQYSTSNNKFRVIKKTERINFSPTTNQLTAFDRSGDERVFANFNGLASPTSITAEHDKQTLVYSSSFNPINIQLPPIATLKPNFSCDIMLYEPSPNPVTFLAAPGEFFQRDGGNTTSYQIRVDNNSNILFKLHYFNPVAGLILSGADGANESIAGIARIAQQGVVDAGVDDTRFITPLKLAQKQGHDPGDFFVSANGNDTTGTGTYENPYLTIAQAESQTSFAQEILIGSGVFTENFALSGKNNIGLNSTFSRFYGGSGNHSGNCIIQGNIDISGATTTRFRMAGTQVGTGGVGGQLNITDTQGRMYFRNNFFSAKMTASGDAENWFEYHEIGFATVPDLYTSGNPDANVVHIYYNCSFPLDQTLFCTKNITVAFINCPRIPPCNFTNGNLIIDGVVTIGEEALGSVAYNNAAGVIRIKNASTLQPDLTTFGVINIANAAIREISNVQRNPAQDVINTAIPLLPPSPQSLDVAYQPVANSIYGTALDVATALNNLNSLNPYAGLIGWVSSVADPNGDGSFLKPFNTIQAAIDAAASGTQAIEYIITPGIYTENLTIPASTNYKLKAAINEEATFLPSNSNVAINGSLTLNESIGVFEGIAILGAISGNNTAVMDTYFNKCALLGGVNITGNSSPNIIYNACTFVGDHTYNSTNPAVSVEYQKCYGDNTSVVNCLNDITLMFCTDITTFPSINCQGDNLYINGIRSIAKGPANTTIKFRGPGGAALTGLCSLLGACNVATDNTAILDISCNELASTNGVIRNSGIDVIARNTLVEPTAFV